MSDVKGVVVVVGDDEFRNDGCFLGSFLLRALPAVAVAVAVARLLVEASARLGTTTGNQRINDLPPLPSLSLPHLINLGHFTSCYFGMITATMIIVVHHSPTGSALRFCQGLKSRATKSSTGCCCTCAATDQY